ncbi:hypothetical protein VTK73DRAFT_10111 [Phialemonium thermophilum]|uniref:Transposase n=1 Tax=Phialemonium thermophilum TaxID=223376 RepID=A0ABR3XH94_9PEZI
MPYPARADLRLQERERQALAFCEKSPHRVCQTTSTWWRALAVKWRRAHLFDVIYQRFFCLLPSRQRAPVIKIDGSSARRSDCSRWDLGPQWGLGPQKIKAGLTRRDPGWSG